MHALIPKFNLANLCLWISPMQIKCNDEFIGSMTSWNKKYDLMFGVKSSIMPKSHTTSDICWKGIQYLYILFTTSLKPTTNAMFLYLSNKINNFRTFVNFITIRSCLMLHMIAFYWCNYKCQIIQLGTIPKTISWEECGFQKVAYISYEVVSTHTGRPRSPWYRHKILQRNLCVSPTFYPPRT